MKPTTLKEFHTLYPTGFDSISVDVVGYCVAKCKYCPSGNDLSNAGSFISEIKYAAILAKLKKYGFYTNSTSFHIYGLGEPSLHPKLNEILKITHKMGFTTNYSTNIIRVPNIDKEGLKAVKHVIISMPGFSQESYDKIHGFKFELIVQNIKKLKKIFKNIPFDMSYHIYQFNLHEIEKAKKFCDENGIRFALNYAVMFDKNRCLDYVANKMPYEELKTISKEIFLGVLDDQIKASSRNYCDFQERYLAINVNGDIRICNSYTKKYEKNILCGNILTDDIDKIIKLKFSHPKCKICMAAGLSLGKIYDCKVYPDFYYNLMRENSYIKDAIKNSNIDKNKLSNEIKLMHQIRLWEQEHYSDEELSQLQSLIKLVSAPTKKIGSITKKYGRFPMVTWKKLQRYV
ncbi:MAG: radical SAM protein [Candidatus Gottesmanbacteria bacterium]|nr:radical SAM protein [Candidatus Gottesmanbacteria bacterium]